MSNDPNGGGLGKLIKTNGLTLALVAVAVASLALTAVGVFSGKDALPNADVETQAAQPPADQLQLSAEAIELRGLWNVLKTFQGEPDFHRLGFGQASPYARWAEEVRALNARAGRTIFSETGVSPADLRQLADTYQRSEGKETDFTNQLQARFEGALAPKPKSASEGRISRTTDGCEDFDMLSKSMWATEEGNFAESARLVELAGCSPLAAGTLVGAPIGERTFNWKSEDSSEVFLQVEIEGQRAWVHDADVSY